MSAPQAREARRIVVHGKVQGVFMRAWLVQQAKALGLDGWVRNRADGTVEAMAAGPADRLDAFVAHCRRGSPASQVVRVDVEQADAGEITAPGFTQSPTG